MPYYSNLATEAMRKAAAQKDAEKVQTTNRILDEEFGLTFKLNSPNSFSSSSSAAAAAAQQQIFSSNPLYIDPNDQRIPESSAEKSEPEGENSAFDAARDQKFVSIFSIVFSIELH